MDKYSDEYRIAETMYWDIKRLSADLHLCSELLDKFVLKVFKNVEDLKELSEYYKLCLDFRDMVHKVEIKGYEIIRREDKEENDG